jgi:hypothetical protein
MAAEVTVVTVVDGELDVTVGTQTVRVLVPPGLGVAGFDDETFVTELVQVMLARQMVLPAVLDVARVLAFDPSVLQAVSDALDEHNTDTV